METVLATIFAGLVGYILVINRKKKSAEALLDNLKTKEQLLDHNKTISNNHLNLKHEEKERENLRKETTNKPVSDAELTEFFNSIKRDK